MLHEKFKTLEAQLNVSVLEREDVIHQAILSVLAKQHIFLLGVPGIGKSYLAKQFAKAFNYTGSDGSNHYFQVQTNGGTELVKVFGPVDIQKFKKDSVYINRVENYLPNARIALIDEITRANKMVSDSILGIINEREYDQDGVTKKAPLDMAFATSNFKFSSNHFGALADRFVSWFDLKELSQEGRSILRRKKINKSSVSVLFTEDEVKQAQLEVSKVEISDECDKLIGEIRDTLRELEITISDRKEEALCDIVRAEAWLNGRNVAVEEDCLSTIPCFWVDPEHKSTVASTVRKLCNPQLEQIEQILLDSLTLFSNTKEQPSEFPLEDTSDSLKIFSKSLKDMKVLPSNEKAHLKAIKTVTRLQETIADLLIVKMKKSGY